MMNRPVMFWAGLVYSCVFLSDFCFGPEEQQSSEKQFNSGGKKCERTSADQVWPGHCRLWRQSKQDLCRLKQLFLYKSALTANQKPDCTLFFHHFLYLKNNNKQNKTNSTFERLLTMVCWCLPLTGLRAWISDLPSEFTVVRAPPTGESGDHTGEQSQISSCNWAWGIPPVFS